MPRSPNEIGMSIYGIFAMSDYGAGENGGQSGGGDFFMIKWRRRFSDEI